MHTSGGEDMIRTAKSVFFETQTLVFGVTVPTSLSDTSCRSVYSKSSLDQVKQLAAIAIDAGVDGLACSPWEVSELRALYPGVLLVIPGIRSADLDAHDQQGQES